MAYDYDPTDFDTALSTAKEAVGVASSDSSKDDALSRRLVQTAIGEEGSETWRPYAAAYRWLRANPKWVEKFTGSEGLERRSLNEALAGLAEEQASEDARLGLTVPPHLIPSAPGSSKAPAPVFAPWR